MLGALCVSSALTLTVLYGGQISGACYNPAVGIAINLWSALTKWDGLYLEYVYIYLIAPLVGGSLAGLLVNKVLDQKIKHSLTGAELKCTVDVDPEIIEEKIVKENENERTSIEKCINAPFLERKNLEEGGAFNSFSELKSD